MPPKKKFKVRNPGNPIVAPKAKAKPKKKLVLKKKPKMEEKPKPKKKFSVNISQELIRHIFELDKGETIKDEVEYMDLYDKHYSTLYPHMIEPSKKPNKKLKSYKAEFSTKDWRDYEKDDETENNLMDITHSLKFGILSGDSFSQWYSNFKKKMPAYAKYWLDYYKENLKKKTKK